MIDAGAVLLRVLPDMKDFAKETQKGVQTSLRNVGGSLQKTGAIASGLVTAPILAGFAKAQGSASDLNESVNAVNVVFGDASDTIHNFAKSAAKDAGLSQSAFNQLVTPIGASLQNVGFGADEAAEASVNLAARAADMASVFNVDVDEALGAIQAGLRGEADPLERFGVGLSDAAVTAHAMEMGLADADGELDANAKTQARLSLLMEQTNGIAGDFANTSGEVANQERIAAAQAENLAANLGQKLLPAKAKAIELASGLLDRFNGLSPSMQDTALATAGVAAAAGPAAVALGSMMKGTASIIENGPKIASAVGGMATRMWGLATAAGSAALSVARAAASMIASAATATASVVKQIAVQIARWIVLGTQSLIQAGRVAAAWIISMGPIALVIAAVVGLVVLVVKNWDTILAFTKKVWNAVWGWVKDIATKVRDWVVKTWTDLKNKVTSIFTGLRDGVTNLVTSVRDRIVERITTMRDRAVSLAQNLLTRYITFWTDLRDRVVNFATQMRDRAVSLITTLRDRASNLATALRDRVRDAAQKMKDWVIERVQGLKDGAIDKFEELVAWVKDLPGKIVKAIGDLSGKLVQAGKDLMTGLIKGIKKNATSIWDAINPFSGDGLGIGATDRGGHKGQPPMVRKMMGVLGSRFPGVDLISGYRPGSRTSTGNVSYHARGRAVDFNPSRAMAEYINRHFFGMTKELITPWQDLNIHNGRRHSYSRGIMRLHDGTTGVRHNHWAMRWGGIGSLNSPATFTIGEREPEDFMAVPRSRGGLKGILQDFVGDSVGDGWGGPVTVNVVDANGVLIGTMRGVAQREMVVADRRAAHSARAGGG